MYCTVCVYESYDMHNARTSSRDWVWQAATGRMATSSFTCRCKHRSSWTCLCALSAAASSSSAVSLSSATDAATTRPTRSYRCLLLPSHPNPTPSPIRHVLMKRARPSLEFEYTVFFGFSLLHPWHIHELLQYRYTLESVLMAFQVF